MWDKYFSDDVFNGYFILWLNGTYNIGINVDKIAFMGSLCLLSWIQIY